MPASRNEGDLDSEIRVFLGTKFPNATIHSIRNTNNLVYRIECAGKTFSDKVMVDDDIPVEYFVEFSKELQKSIRTQAIIEVFRKHEGAPSDCIVSSFIEGRDLAKVLNGRDAARSRNLIGFLLKYVETCVNLPRFFEGFGTYKTRSVRFEKFEEFLDFHARKYWSRARKFYDPAVAHAVDRWVDGLEQVAKTARSFRPVAIDSNLRNFIVDDSGEVILLNVPIVAWSCRAHAVGAVSAHLRPFRFRDEWLDRATENWSAEERASVSHYEAWTLLGILSFYAVRAPDRPDEWRNWGAERSLREDFADLILQLDD
ncbi:MAG: hypothetical protein ACKOPM_09270 [Novosphingobium sp.]